MERFNENHEGYYAIEAFDGDHVGVIRAFTKEEIIDKTILACNDHFASQFDELHTNKGFENLLNSQIGVFQLSGQGEELNIYICCSWLYD